MIPSVTTCISIGVLALGHGTVANAQWTDEQKILAQVPGSPFVTSQDDNMGQSVAVDGNYAIVGVPGSSISGSTSGVAFVYFYDGSAWVEDQVLTPTDGEANDNFGYSVAISGNTALVGAYGDDDNGSYSGAAYIFENTGGGWGQVAKLTASDGAADDYFGYSVALSGSTALMGAYGDDDHGSRSGAAYIFENVGGSWGQLAKLTALGGATEDLFGLSVALSGSTALVGAYGDDDNGFRSGSAYIFKNAGGSWVQGAKLTALDGAADDLFGTSVALSGSTALVGAYWDDDNGSKSGSAYIFENMGGSWVQVAKLTASDGAADENFGYSVALSGSTALVGAWRDDDNGSNSGSAYLFENTGGSWGQVAKLAASDGAVDDYFGMSVGLFGSTALAGAYGDDDHGSGSGSAYIFENTLGTWSQTAKLITLDAAANNLFGVSVSISGNKALVGAYGASDNGSHSGSAYIFENTGGSWSQVAKLTALDAAANDLFGYSVSLSGSTALVGAPQDADNGTNSGSAYIFENTGGSWSQVAKLTALAGAAEDLFGISVSLSGTTALVGAYQDPNDGSESGAAYIFENTGGSWGQVAKLTALDAANDNLFGGSVSLSGNTALVGALWDSDNGFRSGAVYIFENTGGSWGQVAKLTALDAAADDIFGASVSLSGNTVLVGAPVFGPSDSYSGSAYIFENTGGSWGQVVKLTSSDGAPGDQFGASVSLSGNTALVGSKRDDDHGSGSGSAYIFENTSGSWGQVAKLTASDGAADDLFGNSVSLSGSTALVGAPQDDGNGINSGSAYFYSQGSACTGNQVVVAINTDNNPGQLTWEILDESDAVIATGGPASGQANMLVTETVCLGSTPASVCYGFRLMDSFGDGISNGGWELLTTDGKLLLRDEFNVGFNSPSATPLNPNYMQHNFCLPAGPANISATECGIFDNLLGNKVYCNKVTGASNYQFEFSDPDAGFIRRTARPYNYVHFWDMVTTPLVPGVKYFARVRTDRDGTLASAHFGSGCEMGLGQVVICTQLIQAPAYGHSCNETRTFNTSANNSFIYAKPVQGATEYQFRIFNTQEGYDQTFIRSTYILQLKWNNNVAPPLTDGYTYSVEMNVKVNGVYSGFCASTCNITIDNSGPAQSMVQRMGNATMWPNPVRDGQVNLNIDGLVDAEQHITVDIQDVYGKQVFAKEFGNSGERFNTILNLNSKLAGGVYMVNITVNGERTVQRLSIIR